MYHIEELNIRGELILKALFTGEFNPNVGQNFIDDVSAYEENYPGIKLLADFSGVVEVQLNFKELKSFTNYIAENSKRTGKAAIVTGNKVGRILLAKLFVDLLGLLRSNENKSFASSDDAMDWLCAAQG